MQLSELLEKNTMKEISQKTNISEKNLGYLLDSKFELLQKIKVLGFISILEREYGVNLSQYKEQASDYYASASKISSIAVSAPNVKDKKGKSSLLVLLGIAIIALASWYFFTQFDKKHLQGLLSFSEDETLKESLDPTQKNENKKSKKISLAHRVVASLDATVETNKSIERNTSIDVNKSEIKHGVGKVVFIKPTNRLWFGIVNARTKKRDHFSITEPFELKTEDDLWLVATSCAPFSLLDDDNVEKFSDAKEHYFKISKNGIKSLNKNEYVKLGGWEQW